MGAQASNGRRFGCEYELGFPVEWTGPQVAWTSPHGPAAHSDKCSEALSPRAARRRAPADLRPGGEALPQRRAPADAPLEAGARHDDQFPKRSRVADGDRARVSYPRGGRGARQGVIDDQGGWRVRRQGSSARTRSAAFAFASE
eukprot:161385-Prymnesium_polylepis.1